MGGIAGYWSTGPVELVDLATFTDMMTHRGPDDFGYLAADDRKLGMGHRRLAVLDPESRSRQPMTTADGRYSIVFNGEVFNFLELRVRLIGLGYQFKTDSDTEVVLYSYARWGPACQDMFNGMWAFAIWDNTERRLFLSRDRFGIKPLFMAETPAGMAFASEARAFEALAWTAPGEGGLGHTITRLAAGKSVTLTGPRQPVRQERWWQPLDYIHFERRSHEQHVERFRELLFDSCRMALRSDAPLATTVSGGLDSSSLLAAIGVLGKEQVARRPGDWSKAFTSHAAGTDHDELEYARAAGEPYGVDPFVVDLFDLCDADHIDDYLYLTGGMPLTNLFAWYVYRAMHDQGIKVAIDGSGADSMLAGHHFDAFRVVQREANWIKRPLATWNILSTVHELTAGSPYIRMNSRAALWIRLFLFTIPPARAAMRKLPGRRFQPTPILRPGYDPEIWEMAQTLPGFNSITFVTIMDSISSLFERYDALSMSSGIETRMPYMDWRLVCYAMSMPAESAMGGGFTKRVLRDAMTPYLPPKIIDRKAKLQFQGPIGELLRGSLRSWMESHLDDASAVAGKLENGSYAEIGDIGLRLVDNWERAVYPGMVRRKVEALRDKHRSDPETLARHAVLLG